LRLRFFITIFIVLTLTAASVSAIHYHFFKLERIRLMQLNLQQNASLLAESDLSMSRKEFSNLGQDFIDEVIGDDKINMIVAIYSANGKVLYKNDNAYIFELPDTISEKFEPWEDDEYNEYLIKYLTQKDSKNNRIIKVGMILNQSLIRWQDLNQRISIFVAIILLVIIIISFFLTYILFKPVQDLAEQVNLMAEKIENGEFLELKSWFHKLKGKTGRNDEFNSLIRSLDKLSSKITETQKLTQKWSALMAHELKTPMTLLRMSIDEMITESNVSPKAMNSVEVELKKLESIIMDFLEWASAENDSSKPELHVFNPHKRTEELILFLEKTMSESKIEFINKSTSDFKVFCNPIHFDQVINNLLTNAHKHGQGLIKVECDGPNIKISDNGPGMPDSVLENFGKPFNKYHQKEVSGHGLGLAWVNTIAKKYNWKISFKNNAGTQVEIHFPLS
jgi:signal transduction histidine kinase